MATPDFGPGGKYTLVVFDNSSPIPVLIEEEVQDFVEEAAENGVNPAEFLRNLLLIAAMAMRQGVFPELTSTTVGRVNSSSL